MKTFFVVVFGAIEILLEIMLVSGGIYLEVITGQTCPFAVSISVILCIGLFFPFM